MGLRVGMGYDVHRLVAGRQLVLGGVTIPYHLGLLGHSDADVLVHALMDALLGAIGEGDIGQHFPDSDPMYAGADSMLLLARIMALVMDAGYMVANADVQVIAQQPRVSPYREAIRGNLADVLGVSPRQVNVKATTTEGLGFVGRGEGIAAQAVVLLIRAAEPEAE